MRIIVTENISLPGPPPRFVAAICGPVNKKTFFFSKIKLKLKLKTKKKLQSQSISKEINL